jgi:hypothetical protein
MRCLYARWRLSNALDRGELDAAAGKGHVASCARCQAHVRALRTLDARLQDGAALAPEPAAPRRRLLVAPLVLAAAAAGIAVIALRSPSDPPEETVAAMPSPALDNVRRVADRVTEAVTAERTSLDAELDALAEDGRRGLDAALLGLRDRPQ